MSFLSTIAMPNGTRSKLIVLHEISHILADRYYGRTSSKATAKSLPRSSWIWWASSSVRGLSRVARQAFAERGELITHSYHSEGD